MRVATALRCVPPSRGWTNPLTMTATDRRRASSLVSCAKCGGTFIFDCVACAGGRCARALFVALIFLESTTREPPSSCAHETKPWARPPPPRCRGHPPPPTTRDAQQSTGPVARHRSPRGMQSFILATEGGGVVAPPRRLRARRLAGGESAGVVAAAALPRPPWGLVDGVGGGDPAAKKATFATAATARGSRPCPPPHDTPSLSAPQHPPPSTPPTLPGRSAPGLVGSGTTKKGGKNEQ